MFVASGSAVGGGSTVYANTLYRAAPTFFANPRWAGIEDWAAVLAPHYDSATRMLGVASVPFDSDNQKLLRELGRAFEVEGSITRTPCAVHFGEAGKTVPDPYFGGSGPDRNGCTRCGACMVGCRVGAKNIRLKNYLRFAERQGVEIRPDTQVVDVRPLGAANRSEGYEVATRYPGAWLRRRRTTLCARGVVFAAGAPGTNRLLADCRHRGSLPALSQRLGALVRTNGESVLAVTLPRSTRLEPGRDVAISASIHVGHDTHIECVTYGAGGDFMSSLFTP